MRKFLNDYPVGESILFLCGTPIPDPLPPKCMVKRIRSLVTGCLSSKLGSATYQLWGIEQLT